jgi:hypothetical protein
MASWDWQDSIHVLILIIVTAGVTGIFVVIGQNAGHADNSTETNKSLWTIYGVGIGIVIFLAVANILFITSHSAWKETFILLMLHVSFFMAYIAMGTSLMRISHN